MDATVQPTRSHVDPTRSVVTRLKATTRELTTRTDLVIGAALLMLAAQIGFRAWALYPSWFFLDDYILLGDARRDGLSPGYLMEPYGGHLMPVGRLVVWVVEASGPVNWGLAATLTLVMQLLASLAAWWMLSTLFGVRWSVLVPYAVYLSSTMTFPATIWWAPALNLVPVQACFFAATAAWVIHLRTRRRSWLWVTVAVLLAGLACDVKASLVVPVLHLPRLARTSNRARSWLASVPSSADRLITLAAVVVPVLAYAAYYLTQVPQITQDSKACGLRGHRRLHARHRVPRGCARWSVAVVERGPAHGLRRPARLVGPRLLADPRCRRRLRLAPASPHRPSLGAPARLPRCPRGRCWRRPEASRSAPCSGSSTAT